MLSKHLVRPLFKLRKNLQDFASGSLDTRPDNKILTRGDEIGVLAQEFSNMADKIQDLIENSKQLLQDVSHELRSPLARLQIASSLMQQKLDKGISKTSDKKDMEKMISRIDKECEVLNDLIAEVLSYFRMQMNQESFVTDKIDLVSLLNDLIKSVAYENQVGIEKLKLFIENKSISYNFIGHKKLLIRAVENILRNAMKYTEDGRVDLYLIFDKDENKFIIEIRDYGEGVPEHMIDRLFDPFFRVHSDRSQQYGGYGLGLSIAKRAVILHGGDIKASCHPVSGLLVRLILPKKT